MTVENISIDVKTNAGDAAKQFRSLSSALDRVRNAGRSVSSGGTHNSLSNIGRAAKSATRHTSNLLSSIKRIAMYRLLRTFLKEITQAFQEGLKNAYAFSKSINGDLAAALDRIASGSGQMKNQMGAAFGELLTTLEPIITAIISLISQLMQALSALFAALGGRASYTVADKTAAGWDKAAGAAKKYKNTVLGFDELNRLNDETGGGGGGADLTGAFHLEELPEWALKLQEDVENIKTAFSEWWNDPSAKNFWKLLSSISQLLTDIARKIVGLSFDNVIIPFGTFLDKLGETFGMEFNFEKNLTDLRDDLYDLYDAIDKFMNEPSWENFNGILREFFDILDDLAHLLGDPVFEVLIKIGEWIDAIGAAFGQDWHVADTLREWKKAFDEFDLVTWWDTKVKPWLDNFDLKRDVLALFGLPEVWSIETEWESITTWFKDLPNKVWQWLLDLPNNIKERFNTGFSNIKDWKDEVEQWAKEQIPKLSEQMGDFFDKLPERIGYWLGFADGKILQWKIELAAWAAQTLPKVAEEIGNYFEDVYTQISWWFGLALGKIKEWKISIKTWADEKLPQLIDDITNWFQKLPEKLFQVGVDMVNAIWRGIKSVWDWLQTSIDSLLSGFNNLGSLSIGFNRGQRDAVGIPAAAEGGLFPNTGSLIWAGEAGPEIVANVGSSTGVMNVRQMEDAVANGNINVVNAVYAMANMIVKAVESIDTDVTLDGESLADKMYRYNQNAANRYGAAMVT